MDTQLLTQRSIEASPAQENQKCIKKPSLDKMLYTFVVTYLLVNSALAAIANEPKDLQKFKLDCEPGEQRHFNYESSTRVWGSSSQQVRLRASLKLRCMRPLEDGSLKYLAEVLNVTAYYDTDKEAPSKDGPALNKSSSARSLLLKNRWQQVNSARAAAIFDQSSPPLRAEPVFEEIGEAATRVRRSVSGWFNKTWTSVKDFFTNIFQSSEKSNVDREQAFKESGLDIGQCKAPGGGKQNGIGLPIDDSVFDDLEPKYYVGASSSPDGLVTAYEFGDDPTNDLGEDEQMSFFDDPKLNSHKAGAARSKRGASPGKSGGASWPLGRADKLAEHERLLKLPFVFVQSRSGRVLEVRFGADELDLSVKNFKRHLCDLFATNLDGGNQSQAQEVSPIGQHTTRYLLDQSLDSKGIKESLMSGDSKQQDQQSSRQLVRALAVVAAGNKQQVELDLEEEDGDGNDGRSHGDQLSVLRSINSTNNLRNSQANSGVVVTSSGPALAGDIDRVEVRVKQVQQISDGRMVGSAGQLAMSLVPASSNNNNRPKRSTAGGGDETVDIADLLQVSTSFTVQLVPVAKLGNFEVSEKSVAQKRSSQDTFAPGNALPELVRARRHAENNGTSAAKTAKRKREPFVMRPSNNTKQLEKTLDEWRRLESRLEMKPANLTSESGGRFAGQIERLEVLRDQIQMRLNEEFTRNRMRQARGPQPVAAVASAKAAPEEQDKDLLGLSLTQLILDTGISSKHKGSVYLGIEEALDLEWDLAEQSDSSADSSVGKLLRETVRMDKLRTHCKSSIATLADLRSAQSSRLELKSPFGVSGDQDAPVVSAQLTSSESLMKSRRKCEQCKQVLHLLLRAGERQAPDLVIDLMDTCNSRLLAAAKQEELGHGPASRYYRNLRQQFTELLSQVRKPTDSLFERLTARLSYKLPQQQGARGRADSTAAPPDFTYVSPTQSASDAPAYNQSQLVDEDDLNNNDGAGSLIMTITALASRQSVKRSKRQQIVEKLLAPLKNSRCSLSHGPDLDILESMANFQEPLEELVGSLVQLARRCRDQDQYLVACVHALQGQVRNQAVQRLLVEQLRSNSSSCLLKSEIVLTLINVMQQQTGAVSLAWPAVGSNRVDETLAELVGASSGKKQAKSTPDARCLGQLVAYYMELKPKRGSESDRKVSKTERKLDQQPTRSTARNQRRLKRAIPNENNFWDEAQCKRWSVNDPADPHLAMPTMQDELLEEIDDNSMASALVSSKRARSGRLEMLPLVERENGTATADQVDQSRAIRRRHKCTASKKFGPKNAEATLRAEIVNDLIGPKDENKFLARFRLGANFLGQRIDVGRMYLWHQKRTTRAHVNIMGKSLWDTSHGCQDQAPRHLQYMPLFDFNLWLVKVSVGLRLNSQMGFFTNCQARSLNQQASPALPASSLLKSSASSDQLELYPSMSVQASAEASAKFVVARAGLSLAGQYGYQGNIRVSKQPESCMSVQSGHQPMNLTFASWFQLWDSDCHYWGSRLRGEPQATKWRLLARRPSVWLEDECLNGSGGQRQPTSSSSGNMTRQAISP